MSSPDERKDESFNASLFEEFGLIDVDFMKELDDETWLYAPPETVSRESTTLASEQTVAGPGVLSDRGEAASPNSLRSAMSFPIERASMATTWLEEARTDISCSGDGNEVHESGEKNEGEHAKQRVCTVPSAPTGTLENHSKSSRSNSTNSSNISQCQVSLIPRGGTTRRGLSNLSARTRSSAPAPPSRPSIDRTSHAGRCITLGLPQSVPPASRPSRIPQPKRYGHTVPPAAPKPSAATAAATTMSTTSVPQRSGLLRPSRIPLRRTQKY